MNEINKRFKDLRLAMGKTQEETGAILGISKSGIGDIEAGRRNVTEQHIIMLQNYSECFVNVNWLRTGEGEMFLDVSREVEIARFTKSLFLEESDSFKNRLISALAKLSVEEWEVLEKIADSMATENTKKE